MCPHTSRSILLLCVVILAYTAIMCPNTNMLLCTYIHTYISIKKINFFLYTYIRTYIYACVHIYIRGRRHQTTPKHISKKKINFFLYTYIRTYKYAYVSIYIYAYVSIYMSGGAVTRLRQNCKNANEVLV
jgi:hypothetical protein